MPIKLAVAALIALAGSTLAAKAYPDRPITLIVPYAAGGSSDVLGRLLGERLSKSLGQPIVIDNRAGAGGALGTDVVAKAAPDGTTIAITSAGALAISIGLQEKLPYDTLKHLKPVTLVATVPELLVAATGVPASNLTELIALARAKPGTLNYASSGPGSMPHLAGELLKVAAKVDIVHVAYKGAAPALQDVIAGHVQMMFATAASVIGLIRDNKVRALAVTTPKRTALLPDLPTVDELGLKGFDATTWHGLVAPAGTPKEVIDTLSFAVTTALKDPLTQKALFDLGVDVVGSSQKEFEAYIKAEIPKWTAVVKASGANIE
jgi:tripartite-type tricarboxylate transporter receptor subunit TctC